MHDYSRGEYVFVQIESDVQQVLKVKEDLGESIITQDKTGRFEHYSKKKVAERFEPPEQ